MGAREEAVVRELVEAFADGWPDDLDKALSALAEDATYQMIVPSIPPLVGREAIKAEIARQMTYVTTQRHELVSMGSGDRFVFTERLDQADMMGKVVDIPLVAVFEVRDDKVVSWREYMDPMNIAGQLGITPEQLAAAIMPAS